MLSSVIRSAVVVALVLCGCAPAWARNNIVRVVPEHVGACQAPCSRVAVIFVHGITGSRGTWTNPETGAYWPGMLVADANLREKLDVYRLDYETFHFSGPAINEIGQAVGEALDPIMKEKLYAQVIFIAHSMGGIVAQAYLLRVKLRYGHTALARFPFFITLGTPFKGSSLARIARLATLNRQVRILIPIEGNDYQQFLNTSWLQAREKNAEWCGSRRFQNLINFAAYETKPTHLVGIVVEEDSATPFTSRSTLAVDKDHSGLARPRNESDEPYPWVKELLMDAVENGLGPPSDCPPGDFVRALPTR